MLYYPLLTNKLRNSGLVLTGHFNNRVIKLWNAHTLPWTLLQTITFVRDATGSCTTEECANHAQGTDQPLEVIANESSNSGSHIEFDQSGSFLIVANTRELFFQVLHLNAQLVILLCTFINLTSACVEV